MLSLGSRTPVALALVLGLAASGCLDEGPVDDSSSSFTTASASSSSSAPGDGDGDFEGDGDGDPMTGDGDGDGAPGDGDGDPTGDGDGEPGDGLVPCPGGGLLQLEGLFYNDFGSQPSIVYDSCSFDYAGVSPGGLLAQVETFDGEVIVGVTIAEQPQPGTYAVQPGDSVTSVTMTVAGGGLGPGWTGAYVVSTGDINVLAYSPGETIEFTVMVTSQMQDESHAVDIAMHAILPL